MNEYRLDSIEYNDSLNYLYVEFLDVNIYEYVRFNFFGIFIDCVESGNIDPSANNNYAIGWAAENGQLELVKYLMSLPKSYGIDPSAGNNGAIRWAAENGHLDVVKYLMSLHKEYSIDPSDRDNYAIRGAVENGHLETVKYLLSLDKLKSSLNDDEYNRYKNMISSK